MNETAMKPTSIIALADRVLARNQKRNHNETHAKMDGNSKVQQKDRKFHSYNEIGLGKNLHEFCQAYCPWLESIRLPGEGETPGCINPFAWPGTWRRLDRLKACPARERLSVIHLPEWCLPRCEHYSETPLPSGQIIRKCWSRTLGRNSGLLPMMKGCPLKEGNR